MESSILNEVHNASILRTGLSIDYAVISTSLAFSNCRRPLRLRPAQRAGAQRLRALAQRALSAEVRFLVLIASS
jgi:hypothetical protein